MVFTRFRLLITSVLSDMGRGRPWSLRKRPQALQRTAPVSSRRHSGVVCVVQFWQVGCVAARSWLAMVAMMLLCAVCWPREAGRVDKQSSRQSARCTPSGVILYTAVMVGRLEATIRNR